MECDFRKIQLGLEGPGITLQSFSSGPSQVAVNLIKLVFEKKKSQKKNMATNNGRDASGQGGASSNACD